MAGYSPWGLQESDTTEVVEQLFEINIQYLIEDGKKETVLEKKYPALF